MTAGLVPGPGSERVSDLIFMAFCGLPVYFLRALLYADPILWGVAGSQKNTVTSVKRAQISVIPAW